MDCFFVHKTKWILIDQATCTTVWLLTLFIKISKLLIAPVRPFAPRPMFEPIPRLGSRNQSVKDMTQRENVHLFRQILFIPCLFGWAPLRIWKLSREAASFVWCSVPLANDSNVEIVQLQPVAYDNDVGRINVQMHKRNLLVSVDSVNVGSHPWISEVWGPVGTRLHALHHLFPSMPYHLLPEAHRRLKEQLPEDSLYRQAEAKK